MSITALLLLASPLSPLPAPPLPDAVLAEQRGGFRLPSGIDVALAVQSVTSVNGAIVLNTTFRVDQGQPVMTAYAPTDGEQVAGPASTSTGGGVSSPTISYDARGGLQVTPGATVPRITLTGGGASQSTDGLSVVTPGGPATTPNGTITQSQQGGLRTVELQSNDLTVTHFGGNAFGSAIANSGSDRIIDTQTVISLDLRNAGPDVLGSAMLRAGNVATDAIAFRGQ